MHTITKAFSLLMLAGYGSALHGQAFLSPKTTDTSAPDAISMLHLDSGLRLHLVIDRGFQIKNIDQLVTARVTGPAFYGNRLVVPSGTLVHGHVSSITHAGSRLDTLLRGDFSQPAQANVMFEDLTLTSGETVKFSTEEAIALEPAKTFLHVAKADRPSWKASVKEQIGAAVHTPNKLQKVTEAAVTSLPYHPQFVDEGTRFNVTLQSALDLPLSSLPTSLASRADGSSWLHVRLLTPLNSQSMISAAPIRAIVDEPFYDRSNNLRFPAGSVLTGSVTTTAPARWLQRQGSLNFEFSSIVVGDEAPRDVNVTTVGAEAGRDQSLSIDAEGGIKVRHSHWKRVTAPLSLVGPSRGLADNSFDKTAYQRAGQGRKGFGLVGAGLAQASASTALGFGYYGAAMKLYSAFIAKGTDVDLPAETSLLLSVNN